MKAKEIFNQQAISQTVGICYDYNEVVGKLSINSPNRVSAKERGIPHVLKGVEKPFFRKSIVEPLNETSIIIQEEMRTEDMVNNNVISDQCVPESSVSKLFLQLRLTQTLRSQNIKITCLPCITCLKLIYLIKHVVLLIVCLVLLMYHVCLF